MIAPNFSLALSLAAAMSPESFSIEPSSCSTWLVVDAHMFSVMNPVRVSRGSSSS